MESTKEKNIHRVFVASLILKGLNALIEITLGVLLFFTHEVGRVVVFLSKKELIEDPTDFVASHLQTILPYLSSHSELFAAFYFLSHGVVKVFLIWGVLRDKLWAYLAYLALLSVLILLQIIRFTFTHSSILALLTIFDIFVLWLVWHEYNYQKKKIGVIAYNE